MDLGGGGEFLTIQEGLDAAADGDTVLVDVISGCGDIHQAHTLEQPAYEWVPQQE